MLDANRQLDIYIKNSQKDSITIDLSIPKGYTLVEDKDENSFSNRFGSISIDKKYLNKETYRIEVDIQYNDGRFAPDLVTEYNEFAKQIGKTMEDKVVFKPIQN